MARTTLVNARQAVELRKSLKQLNEITNIAYNASIRQVALDFWKKDLTIDHPQWNYLTFKSFYISIDGESAHILAMLDERLPSKGLIGYFACTSSELGANVITQAFEWLQSVHGITDVYGPINGTLPNDYRLNMNADYVFPGEPVNPSWHISAFKDAGFSVYNTYSSGRLKHFNIWLKFSNKKPNNGDFSVRSFNNDKYADDFRKYHILRNKIFPFQSDYCPVISLAERHYNAPGKFDPNYTYFLVEDGKEIGFIMAYIYKKQLVLKTIGLLPEHRGKDLSRLLLKPVHDQAKKDGVSTAIYAMVRSGNKVHKNKHPLAKEFRHYVTMHKSLG